MRSWNSTVLVVSFLVYCFLIGNYTLCHNSLLFTIHINNISMHFVCNYHFHWILTNILKGYYPRSTMSYFKKAPFWNRFFGGLKNYVISQKLNRKVTFCAWNFFFVNIETIQNRTTSINTYSVYDWHREYTYDNILFI